MKAPAGFPLALIDGMLPSASRISPSVDAVFLALLLTCLLVMLGLGGAVVVFLVRYREGATTPRPPLRIAAWKFETTWILATTAIFIGFFFWGARVYLRMMAPPPGAATVAMIGRQWMWEARHPEGPRELDELHVPVNRPILLRMTSEDVIHSFSVPAFRVKQDVPPGKTVTAWFEAVQPGRYPIYCDQYCGTKHAAMIGEVVVQSPEDYAGWLSRSSTNSDAARRGQALFIRYGCSGCHVGNAAVRAPRLEGIFGRPVPVEGGKFLIADEAYLRDSMLLPTQHVAAGYAAVMPSYAGVASEADLLDLVAYLQSLGTQTPPPSPAGPAAAAPGTAP